MNSLHDTPVRLTSLSHGGGCGCKIAPGMLAEILKNSTGLPVGFEAVDQALLSDPQTSGGLLVSCAPEAVNDVLAVFHREGFAQAAVIGEVARGPARLHVR